MVKSDVTCPKTYAYVGSLKAHESIMHNITIGKRSTVSKQKDTKGDQLKDYSLMLFKLVMLHKNLDSAVDMVDGERSVRSTKYELPIYNKTNKTTYSIGSIHLTALTSGLLPATQGFLPRLHVPDECVGLTPLTTIKTTHSPLSGLIS